MEIVKKYNSWYTGIKLGTFLTLKEAQECITEHPNYAKSKFTKRGKASSNNSNDKEYFKIFDNEGYGWNIK
jgi:hypothetical protein